MVLAVISGGHFLLASKLVDLGGGVCESENWLLKEEDYYLQKDEGEGLKENLGETATELSQVKQLLSKEGEEDHLGKLA